MAVGPFYRTKRSIAASRRNRAVANAEARDRAAAIEQEVQRRVAEELWRRARKEEEEAAA